MATRATIGRFEPFDRGGEGGRQQRFLRSVLIDLHGEGIHMSCCETEWESENRDGPLGQGPRRRMKDLRKSRDLIRGRTI
jgi:hypothetical protein